MAVRRLSGFSESPAATMATSSASRCTTECGRTTWIVASTPAGSRARGSAGAGALLRTLWL
eukprot:2133939-Prorocentrum_lima.AAC.1